MMPYRSATVLSCLTKICVGALALYASVALAASDESFETSQEPLPIKLGALKKNFLGMVQNVTVKNNTGKHLSNLVVECGFFNDRTLIGTGIGLSQDINPDQTVYIGIEISKSAGEATSADCRSRAN